MEEILINAFSQIVVENGNRGGWRYHKQIIETFRNSNAEWRKALCENTWTGWLKNTVNNKKKREITMSLLAFVFVAFQYLQ